MSLTQWVIVSIILASFAVLMGFCIWLMARNDVLRRENIQLKAFAAMKPYVLEIEEETTGRHHLPDNLLNTEASHRLIDFSEAGPAFEQWVSTYASSGRDAWI